MAKLPPIQFKRLHDENARPTAEQLAVGELAINMFDAKLWTKDSDGKVISLSGGDSETVLLLDSEGRQIDTYAGTYEIDILTEDRFGTSWQDNTIVQNAPIGAKVNLFRKNKEAERWTMDFTTGTDNGWGGTRDNGHIASLNYAGVQSWAGCWTKFNDSFKVHEAFTSNQDHASLGILNNYFIFQIFETPVTIGDGTDLGSFSNGRPAYPGENFRDVRVEFFDVNGDLLATQLWTNLSGTGTRTITAGGGTINNVRTVIFRANRGTNNNPGLNRIRLKVNGSNNYPTAAAVGWELGFAWRNVIGATGQADNDEVFCFVHIDDLTTGMLVHGAHDVFGTDDFCPNGGVDTENQVYKFLFHRPWDIGGGTFTNGRVNYTPQFWQEFDLEYYDPTDTLVFNKNISTPVYSTENKFYAHRNIWKIIMRPGTRTEQHPVIQQFTPDLGRSTSTVYPNTQAISQPEVWVKGSTAPDGAYADGSLDQTVEWFKISESIT